MQNLYQVFLGLELRKRIVVIVATLAMVAAVLGMARMASQPKLALLYANLDPAAASEIIDTLSAANVAYDIKGSSIYIEESRRDEMRISLAGEGKPASGVVGYELLDTLSGFGTTSKMFDAAYLRAKEGELARTIMSSPQVLAARVHVAQPPAGRPFDRGAKPSASITVTTRTGNLSKELVSAFRFLVAAAVPEMEPSAVAVMDTQSGLLTEKANDPVTALSQDVGEQEAALERSIERLLSARVGTGNAVVEASLEAHTEAEQIVERKLDPDGRVAISSDTQERSQSRSQAAANPVTVASNLPDQRNEGNSASGSDEESEVRELVNYEVSETTVQTQKLPGAIKRITVAVLVDGIASTDDSTGEQIWTPRSEDELANLKELVATAAGIDETRGDIVTVKSMQFQRLQVPTQPLVQRSLADRALSVLGSQISTLFLLFAVVIIVFFVLRPLLLRRDGNLTTLESIETPQIATQINASTKGEVTTNQDVTRIESEIPHQQTQGQNLISQGTEDASIDLSLVGSSANDPVKKLSLLIEERQDESIETLNNWIDVPKEGAR